MLQVNNKFQHMVLVNVLLVTLNSRVIHKDMAVK